MADWHISRVEAPETEPLTLAQVKSDRVVTHDEHDADFELYIQAAREAAEGKTGRALITQKWQQSFTEIGRDQTALPLIRWPVKTIEQVKINGEIVDHSKFEFLPEDDAVIDSSQFAGQKVTVIYSCGYGDAADVPAAIKKWMLSTVGSMYENRETEITGTIISRFSFIDNLIKLYRISRFW
jgi:uncharacterized phiE125 gp8 family phage protein